MARVVVIALLAAATVFSQAPNDGASFRFFKNPQPLRPDFSVVAVLPASGADAGAARAALLRHGVAATSVREFDLAPWLIAEPPPSFRRAGSHARFLRLLAEDDAFAFVSPQWRDATGAGVIVLPGLTVAFKAHVAPEVAGRVLAEERAGTLAAREFCGVPNTWRIRPSTRSGLELLRLSNRLAEHALARFSEPDFAAFGRPQHVPDDPAYPRAWGLHDGPIVRGRKTDLGCEEAWDLTIGSPETPILILDCGVARDHPDLVVADGVDATLADLPGDGGPASPLDFHGTAVAGCASAIMDNGRGGAGVAPACALLSARVYRCTTRHGYVVEPASVARALWWGRSRGARVSNFSAYLSVPSALTAAAYERAYELGMCHFAAAGNGRSPLLPFPANLPFVNAVAALAPTGDLASFSNFGDGLAFAAPGQDVFTTDLIGPAGYSPNEYTSAWGTSFASPLAAGVAALVLSVDPTLDAAAVQDILRRTATDLGDRGHDPSFGHGVVHAGRAARVAVNGEDVESRVRRASVAASGLQGDGPSVDPAFSADGRFAAFASEASGFARDDRNGVSDVFVRDRLLGTIVRVSVGTHGEEGDGASREPSISADGRFVAFVSYATTFDASDRNGVRDVYVRDRDADDDGVFDETDKPGGVATTRVSHGGARSFAAPSGSPALDAEGRVIAFESAARDLLPNDDARPSTGIYVAVRGARGFRVVSRASAPTAAEFGRGDARRPALSPNGRTLAFESAAEDLADGDRNGRTDVFVVALDADGAPVGRAARAITQRAGDPDGESRRPCVGADGSVYFATTAGNFEDSPRAPGVVRLARRNPNGRTTYLDDAPEVAADASVAADATLESAREVRERVRPALHERLAIDGASRTLVFVGVGARAASPGRDAFRFDLIDGRTTRVVGRERLGAGRAGGAAISADGRTTGFDSDATEIVRGDSNLRRDVFVVD